MQTILFYKEATDAGNLKSTRTFYISLNEQARKMRIKTNEIHFSTSEINILVIFHLRYTLHVRIQLTILPSSLTDHLVSPSKEPALKWQHNALLFFDDTYADPLGFPSTFKPTC